jgi:hypothetical protein
MNTIQKLRTLGLAIMLLAGASVQEKVNAQPGVSISFQTFYNELSPYGRWINSPQYGSVWSPYVDRGFQPYSTNGYWEVTEYGNTWVSDYEWGWAPFHYGRWSHDDYNGWFWVPGYEWGPAWVNWRSGGDYYGWAPLGPGMNVNISVNLPSFWWVFVPQRYITTRNWYNYCPPRSRVTRIYNQTTIINNYYRQDNRTYAYGPRREDMERVTRSNIPVRDIDHGRRGRVITDRSPYDRYDAPDRNAPVYRQNGRNSNNNGRYSNAPSRGNSERYDAGSRSSGSNERVYERPSRSGNSEREVYQNNNRNSEANRPVPNAPQPNREYRAPSTNTERNGRSQADMGSRNSGRSQTDMGSRSSGRSSGNEAPAIRQAPAERNSAPRENRSSGSESQSGGSRSERSSRSPR